MTGVQTCALPIYVLAATPDNLVVAALGWPAGREQQRELVGDVELLDMEAHAALGNVGNEAIVLLGSGSKDDCPPPAQGDGGAPGVSLQALAKA